MNRPKDERQDGFWRDDLARERDGALWDLLGEVKSVDPSREFGAKVAARLLADDAQGSGRLVPMRRISTWRRVAVVAAAAGLILSNSDYRRPPSPSVRPVARAEFESVERDLAAMEEDDLAAFEIDGIASVNEEWFGG